MDIKLFTRIHSSYAQKLLFLCGLMCVSPILESTVPFSESSVLISEPSSSSETALYENNELSLSFNYPKHWERKKLPPFEFILFAPQSASQHENVRALINLLSVPIEKGVSMEKIYEESIVNLKQNLKNFSLISSRQFSIKNHSFPWIHYSHSSENRVFEVWQLFLQHKGNLLILTFSAPQEKMNTYQPLFQQVLSSLKTR